jgi:hypothetical protein
MFQAFDEPPSGVFRLQLIKKVAPGFTLRLLALDLCSEARKRLIEAIDLTSQLGPHNAMMGFDAAIQRFRQLIACAAQATVGQVCQRLRGSVTGKQGRQHHSP